MKEYKYSLIIEGLLFLLFITSCGKPNSKTDIPVEDIHVHIAEIKTDISQFEPVIWEKNNPSRKEWSKIIYSVIENEEPEMLGQNAIKDIHVFCPTFERLTDAERLSFWGHFFAALSSHESSWDPTTRSIETSQGIDPVTQRQVVSEGLLQLSYQDEKSFRLDCGFNWERDQNLAAKDPRKTILNPLLNLKCGVKIMARRLKDDKALTKESGVYWAPLKRNSRLSKIKEIAKATRALKICR
jgi:hypothetical protein